MTVKDWIALTLCIVIMIALCVLCDILITASPYVILIVVRHEVAKIVANWLFFSLLVPEILVIISFAVSYTLDKRSET